VIKVGIIGATGYTGIELLRLLHTHPQAQVMAISSRQLQGSLIGTVFPSLIGRSDLCFCSPDDVALFDCDVVFFATPHGVAMQNAEKFIAKGIKVIDLGADFRLKDKIQYQKWYALEHTQSDLLEKAVYGLPESNRAQIKTADLIANPGCYPTAIHLALKPLIEAKLINLSTIIADCKSGVSGAGRGASQATLLCETSESFKAYGVSGHRHLPEIIQSLEVLAKTTVNITFVPHLVPMIRGMLATIYVDLLDGSVDVQALFEKVYQNEPFVTLLPLGTYPETRSVKSSNFCQIALQTIPSSNKLVIMSAIDNVTKGASGQAIQNMNILFDLKENLGLEAIGLLP
jgi:N-acetyl-gamma-glutamyl-phosphate reductase